VIKKPVFICYILLLCLTAIFPANTQQTIFNVPNADVTPKGYLYTENEAQFKAWDSQKIYILTQYSNLGIGHNTDLEASLYNIRSPKPSNATMGYGFKSFVPLLKGKYSEREFKLTVGSQLLVSHQGDGVGNWSYTHLSGRIPLLNARLTAGVSAGTRQFFGKNTVCFIGGYEYPVTKRFSIIGDWYSGANNNGFYIPGISCKLSNYSSLYVGYRIRNAPSSGQSGMVIEVNAFIPVFVKY